MEPFIKSKNDFSGRQLDFSQIKIKRFFDEDEEISNILNKY